MRCSLIAALLLLGSTNTALHAQPAEQKKVATPAVTGVFGHGVKDGHSWPWPELKEADITGKTRQLLDIAVNEKGNEEFLQLEKEHGTKLIDLLIKGVKEGKLIAYAAKKSSFSQPLAIDSFTELIAKTGLQQKTKASMPVVGYKIKEDVLTVKNTKEKLVHIIGLAPIVEVKGTNGKTTEQPLFWLHYPGICDYINGYKSPEHTGMPKDWYSYFEAHTFVTKESKDKTAPPIGFEH
jgi:hypothetical protein